tara:strand:- start:223 stop:498 length:276 start_codon:yes stop_codon:yes gene_type:complete
MSDRNKLEDFKITLTVRVPEQSVEYVYNSIIDGMEFDGEEGIRHYDVQKVETVTNGDPVEPLSFDQAMAFATIAGIMNDIKSLSDQIKGGE